MLAINPYMRPSSLECLTSGAFEKEIAEFELKERNSASAIELPIDADGIFDYE